MALISFGEGYEVLSGERGDGILFTIRMDVKTANCVVSREALEDLNPKLSMSFSYQKSKDYIQKEASRIWQQQGFPAEICLTAGMLNRGGVDSGG